MADEPAADAPQPDPTPTPPQPDPADAPQPGKEPTALEQQLYDANVEWQKRYGEMETDRDRLKKALDDAQAGHTSALDQTAKRGDDLLIENGKLRKILEAHTGGQLNIDNALMFARGDVSVKDGKLEGEFAYQPLGLYPAGSTVRPPRQEETQPQRQPSQLSNDAIAAAPIEGGHRVPGVGKDSLAV